MSILKAGPSAEDFDAAIRFVMEAWAMLPRTDPAGNVIDAAPDPADLELQRAYTVWLAAKAR